MAGVKETGEWLVKELKKKDISFVEDVVLDDFGDYGGQIFVELDMKKTGNKFIFGDFQTKPLRSISFKVRTVCKRLEKEGKGRCHWFTVPEATYSSIFGRKEFDGYDKDYIKFHYELY